MKPKHDEIEVGATSEFSLRVSIATLVRVVFPSEHGDWSLALERKATLREHEQDVIVKAQPFGGAVRIDDLIRIRELTGGFQFDSERSRMEQDFRIFVRPSAWEEVKAYCLNQFQGATLEFTVLGNAVTIIDVVVDESGREIQGKNTILVDGNEHVSDNGYVLVARWRGSHILETEAKKDGLIAGWGKYEVSEDGQALTISGDDQVIVLDRN